MSFERVYERTKAFEGGYANSITDAGGETFRGISRVYNPNWEGWAVVDSIKAKVAETHGVVNWKIKDAWVLVDRQTLNRPGLDRMVVDFYERAYYRPIAVWGLDELVTDKLFDLGVNVGLKNAAKILQRAVNSQRVKPLEVDGVVGPATKAAAKALVPQALNKAIAAEQEAFYERGILKKKGYDNPKSRKAFLDRARWLP
jgi:lysozyme family protein